LVIVTTFADTRIDKKQFQAIAELLETLPAGFVQQKQVEKLSEDRRKMSEGTLPINWVLRSNGLWHIVE